MENWESIWRIWWIPAFFTIVTLVPVFLVLVCLAACIVVVKVLSTAVNNFVDRISICATGVALDVGPLVLVLMLSSRLPSL